MRKFSILEESIWSDIQDRSSGDVVRKEDDVNLLDLNEFYKYIKDQYKKKVEYIDLDAMGGGNGDVLGVDITEDIILFYKPKRGHILLSWSRVKIPMPFFDELTDRFKVENPNAMRRIITEKDGSCTNKTFVDVIEFFLGHKDGLVNESIWSDIQDRSSGEITRKEDSVNLMDKDEFFEYIKSHYKVIIDCEAPGCGTGYIRFPLFVYPRTVRYILWDPFDKRVMVRTPYIEVWPDDLLSIIYREYKREDIIDRNRDRMTYIYPKEGDGGNQFFLDFIDNMLANVDKPALKKKVLNESIWSDIQDRSAGETVRKEDELTEKDRKDLDKLIVSYANEVVYGRGMGTEACNLDGFCDYIETDNEIKDLNKDKILQYVKDYWADEVCDSVDGAIEQAQSEYHQDMYESIWSDIQDRSSGETIRKEDEMNGDDYNALKTTLKMFGREVRFFGNPKNHPYAPVGSEKYKHTLKDCLKYIDVLNDNGFTNVDFPKLKRYIEANWEKDPMIQKIIQWTADGKNSKEIDQEIRNAAKSDEIWDLNECDGVPGGLTPADVGGMGPAYFPGPNGEPGSGDLPSPTGVVYHQVAPYTMFLKGQKKKKKKKKFRIEDEPCAHSENPPIYSHVDDFRDYVDRTYNNIDRRK